MSKRAIIVGAGIGGLAAAHALRQVGWATDIYEQTAAFQQLGAGIQLTPNATRILGRLGLLEKIETSAFEPESLTLRDGTTGAMLMSAPLKGVCRRFYGAPYLNILRASLHEILASGLKIQMGQRIECYNHSEFTVAADGLHSQLQAQMNGPERPRFTGQVAWRGLVKADVELRKLIPAEACAWLGQDQHIVTYYLKPDLLNFVAVTEQSDWREEGWSLDGDLRDLSHRFVQWHPKVQALISACERVNRWALFDRPPLARWVDNHTALIGDAAHPTLPFLAQGAALAIEDAWMLAKLAPDLKAYERCRKPRATRLQCWARSNAFLYHKKRYLDHLKLKISRGLFHGPLAHLLLWPIFRG